MLGEYTSRTILRKWWLDISRNGVKLNAVRTFLPRTNDRELTYSLVRVLNTRGVGFITYTNEANAQFAKEAMAHQSLDHEEILNVRWATADPNPMAQAREARRIEEVAAEAVRRALPADFIAE